MVLAVACRIDADPTVDFRPYQTLDGLLTGHEVCGGFDGCPGGGSRLHRCVKSSHRMNPILVYVNATPLMYGRDSSARKHPGGEIRNPPLYISSPSMGFENRVATGQGRQCAINHIRRETLPYILISKTTAENTHHGSQPPWSRLWRKSVFFRPPSRPASPLESPPQRQC